jgi:flagellar biosynthesis GTPase FlhF
VVPPFLSIFLLIVFLASVALADDFKTIDGKEYKDATVSRIEPDGILLKTSSGISKVYFGELPKAVQERFHYDAAQAAQFTTEEQAAIAESNAAVAVQQQQETEERQRRAVEIAQQQQQAEEQQRQADATLARQQQQSAQARHRHAQQQRQRATARQASERERQRQIAGAVASQRAQNDQRIDREHMQSLEKMQREKDLWNQQLRVDWARQQLESAQFLRSPHSWIQSDRENYKREQGQLKQLQDRQRWETGNRATAY